VLVLLLVGFVVVSLPASPVSGAAPQATATAPPAATPAQSPPAANAPATPPAQPPAPDAKAYNDANRLTDPDKKVEAMRAFIKDFPDSPRKTTASQAIFDTLVKSRPGDREGILDAAKAIIDGAPEGLRGSSYSRIATRLVETNILLEDAEKFAVDGLKLFDEEEKKRTQRSRATHLATIGRIRIKQGRITEAEQALKDAYAANPEIPAAAIGLAELSEKKGDNKAAIDYWTTAALTGRLSADDRGKFEALYKKVNGTADTLDAALDAKYKTAFPLPIHPEAYKATSARTNRLVLAEVFTGAGCPPCVSVDLGFDGALERYARKDVAVLMYHMHIPAPDPLTNQWSDSRGKAYAISGVPNFAVDGEKDNRGGGGRENTKASYERIIGKIDKALEVPPDAELKLEASLEGNSVRVKATPSKVKDGKDKVQMQIVLVEELISYSGENGIRFHPMVVRGIASLDVPPKATPPATPPVGGFTVDRANPAAAEYTFDLAKMSADMKTYLDDYEKNGRHGNITFSKKPVQMDTARLSVVAFLQEEPSKKVLQSAYVKIGSGTTTSASR
jgi:tetratricopeptide (TPR) repeat protein